MYCAQCGTENADGSQFCASCGAATAAPAPGGSAQESEQSLAAGSAQPVYASPAPEPVADSMAPAYSPSAPAPAPVPTPVTAPKKKRGCVIALAIVGFLMLCCIGSATAAYLGLLSLGKPRDLGVRYSQKDYSSAVTKLGIDVSQAEPSTVAGSASGGAGPTSGTTAPGTPAPGAGATAPGGGATAPSGGAAAKSSAGAKATGTKTTGVKGSAVVTEGPAKGTKVVYEGSVPIDVHLTSAEFSALMSMHHYSPNWLVQDLQVKFGENGGIELSGYVVYQGRAYGGYAQATGALTGPRSVGGSIQVLEGLGVEVPQEYRGPAADYLAGVMNDWLSQMDGLNLQQATVEGGQLHLVGTVPAKVIRVSEGG